MKEFTICPDPDDPRLTRAVEGIDHEGRAITTQVVVERPLTLFLNGREIVTMMTVGDYPECLAVGYLLNQNMLRSGDRVRAVDYDEELETVVVRTDRETDFEDKLRKKTLTSGCAQGTVFGDLMERFDEEHFLQLVEAHRVTHTQLVPTMFSRMLKLPEAVRRRYDVSSLESAVHAAAPCPIPVKRAMIDWWGPIILEYYSATEGMGVTFCDSAEWLAHLGTVGRTVAGELHILDDEMREVPTGATGKLWFKTASPFEYFNDPVKTAEANSPDRTMSTVGDIGRVDEDRYVYLTDRAAFMIVSGGVNIYPQECENLLIAHPKVADAAVFGVPNEEMGEEVKAVVQLMPGFEPGCETEAELIAFCRSHLAHHKCPRSVDFESQLPRSPTGKLYKGPLRDRYWKGHESHIL